MKYYCLILVLIEQQKMVNSSFMSACFIEILFLLVFEVPDKPSKTDVEKKIIVSDNNPNLTATQYPISIDTSWFSNNNGILLKCLVYVRQGE